MAASVPISVRNALVPSMDQSRWARDGSSPRNRFDQGFVFRSGYNDYDDPDGGYPSSPLEYDDDDMAVCTFYQRGMCRFGDNCKNEHPGSQRDRERGASGGFGNNSNRFNAFNSGGDRYRPGQQSGGAFGGNRDSKTPRFSLSKDDIKADLTDQRPIYPLSCYGPGRDAPRQLIEGPVEISPEELRLKYYIARAGGNEAAAQQFETEAHSTMQKQVQSILSDLDGAVRYVEEGLNVHPNRLDIAKGDAAAAQSGNAANNASANPFSKPPSASFGGGNQNQTPAFGQASNSFSQARPSPFGQPSNPAQTTSAFGQASNPGQTTSAFGQASNPGQTTSAFGQASNPGQATAAFGQSSALGGGGAFGKPSMPGTGAFGQPSAMGGGSAFGQSAFGKPSLPGGGGAAFGQASTPAQQSSFGQPSAPGAASAFGKPSQPGQAAAFGQSNALGQNNAFGKPAFGQSAFGQPAQPAAAPPFGQQQPQPQQQQQQPPTQNANPFGQAQQQQQQQPAQGAQSNPFGQQAQTQAPAQQASPFGQSNQQTTAKPNPFSGGASAQTPAFGQTGLGQKPAFGTPANQAQPTPAANPFVQAAQTAAPTQSAFGAQGQAANPFGQAQPHQQAAAPTAAAAAAAAAPPSGPIDPRDRYKEGRPEEYKGEQGQKLEEIYRRVAQMGRFNENEEIPEVPPKCEWIVADAL